MDDNPADAVVLPVWLAKAEKNFLAGGHLGDNTIKQLFRELRELHVALHDLREDHNYPDTVYVVVEEYYNGTHMDSQTIWAGTSRLLACEKARQRLAFYKHVNNFHCVVQSWAEGKVVSTQNIYCPGYRGCPTCNSESHIHHAPCGHCNNTGIVKEK